MRVSLVSALVLALAGPASAHMVVLPAASVAGGTERYTLVVPTEGRSPTVRVELRVPMGVDVASVEAKPGWEVVNEAFPIGAATVRWSGGRIPSGQMMSFDFLAVNPPAARNLTWNATQWYEDGTNDRWGDGAPPDHHASTTTLVAGEGGAAHGHGATPSGAAHEHGSHAAKVPPPTTSPAAARSPAPVTRSPSR